LFLFGTIVRLKGRCRTTERTVRTELLMKISRKKCDVDRSQELDEVVMWEKEEKMEEVQ